MPIPQAVLEQEERANALLKKLNEGGQQPQTPPAQQPAAPAAQPVQQPVAAQSQSTAQPPTPPATQGGSAPNETAEHRYAVLKGKYDAEVPRLNGQIHDLSARMEQQQRLIEQLTEQLKSAQPEPKPLVTQEEVTEYGEGLIDVVRRAAKEELQSRDQTIAALQAELESLKTGVVKSRQLGFFETLNRDHPDWGVLNGDPQFHQWLGEIDPLSGKQRQAILADAQQAQDGARASAVFTAFKKARDTWAAQSTAALNAQQVPDTGASTVTPGDPASLRIFSRQEVNDFYAKFRRGELSPTEAAATESEIQRAMVEGRIR